MSPPFSTQLKQLEELIDDGIGGAKRAEPDTVRTVVNADVISFEDLYTKKTGLPIGYNKVMGDVISGIPKGTDYAVAYMIEEIAHYALVLQKRIQDIKWEQSIAERKDIGHDAAVGIFTDTSDGSQVYQSYIKEKRFGKSQLICSTMGKSGNDLLNYILMQLPNDWEVQKQQWEHKPSDALSVIPAFLVTKQFPSFVERSMVEYCVKKCHKGLQCVGARPFLPNYEY